MTDLGRTCAIGILILTAVAGLMLFVARRSPTTVAVSTPESSASVVVLVDFSKSFVPGKGAGLPEEDRRALQLVAQQLGLLASRYKTVKILWFPIQASEPADALCPPLEVEISLVKRVGKAATPDDVKAVIGTCLDSVIEASKSDKNLAAYTHISGAVAMAARATQDYTNRVLVILSDFKEDLDVGASAATFRLSKERVILLHRPASDEPLNVSGYLARLGSWKKRLLDGGAGEVMAMPLFSVSEARLRAALRPEADQPRTSLTMLVDFKANVFPRAKDGFADPGPLIAIGTQLASLAMSWPQPVTAQWIVVAGSGFRLQAEAPLEYWPRLIKPADLLTEVPDFARALDETARRLPLLGRGVTTTDLSGTIDLVSSAEPAPQSHVLVIISDFPDEISTPAAFRLSAGTRVVMLHRPSPGDAKDPDAGDARRSRWKQRFASSGPGKESVNVCMSPLAGWTPHDLGSCLVNAR